jgi:RNA polymerase sigma-70 factor (ECF subfamily)
VRYCHANIIIYGIVCGGWEDSTGMQNKDITSHAQETYRTRITLIERVRDRYDSASWEDFIRIYRRYVYAIIRNMNLSEQDTEDLTQQLLFHIWKKLPETSPGQIKRFRSWLAATTRNFVTDFIRKRIKDAERMQKAERDDTLNYLKSIHLPDIDKLADREWKLHLTQLALENIKPHFSEKAIQVFHLSLNGTPPREIAKRLNLSKNSVAPLKARIKERLIIEIEQLRNELE